MSCGVGSRYVPHSETTKAHYEQLLLDLRRCLPPGVDDDMEDIAEQALAIICLGGATNAGVTDDTMRQQQAALERLLDTPLRAETRDHLLRYGRLLTDYVAGQSGEGEVFEDGEAAAAHRGALPGGVFDLDEAGPEGGFSASSSSGDSADDEADSGIDLMTGLPKKPTKRTKSSKKLHKDKTLSRFAFSGGPDDYNNDVVGGNAGMMGESEENMFEADSQDAAEWGAAVGKDGEPEAPKISFDEVACNPQYVMDTLRRLFPAQTVEMCEAQATRVAEFISQKLIDDFTLETQLTAFLGGYDNEEVMDWVGDLCGSRWCVVYGLRYAACGTQKEKNAVMDALREHARDDVAVERLYQSLTGKEVDVGRRRRLEASDGEEEKGGGSGGSATRQPPLRRIDLQACAFQDERAPHRYVRATVPQGTQRAVYETHDEVTLPPSAPYNRTDSLVPIADFPTWCHGAFQGVTQLNPMQSRVFDCAFKSDENMLVSAPTGAGKTNVAMMAMLRAVANATDSATGNVNLRELKMVYVAPMKALVQEVVRTFSSRLEPLGLTVAELSGDSAMTQQQMAQTQLIVTTPEKWDIVTRKSVELGVAALLKLLIIDEVHLLHNERGPVLEGIVARTMVQQQLRGAGGIRVVGLSATLPNYEDVASFLQVDRQRGLFVFGSTYRPIPLEQTFCAIKKVRGMNQAAVMNRVAYDKVLQAAQDREQTMIFVHSRKETEYTAQYLKKRSTEERHAHYFIRPGSEDEKALEETVGNPSCGLRQSLLQLLPSGFAIHHAGLSRDERQTVEELFAERRIKVLVCTSTLAWGVNLPANRVIIKGTRVFNGAKGESELLSALDVLQMFGRAGRVGFGANVGRAAIITSAEDLHYYLCVLNQQLPIESQMMKRVVDMLNAEIALGHIETTQEGVRWLQRTYLYVRMRKVPEVYGVRPTASDPLLLHHLENIVHTASEELKAARMAEYDAVSRRIGTTPYGRIASHCYVTAASMAVYLANLTNAMQDADLFRVFAMSSEFSNLTVRVEEQAQMKELLDNAPVAVRESRYTPLAKINILLQCYISRKSLEGLPLMSEIVYIKDSAQRILRALYEICLVREFGRTARQFLQLYTMVVRRQWAVETPIRQVSDAVAPKVFDAILPSLELVRVPWEELRLWSDEDLAERLSDERRAGVARTCIEQVPHFTVEAAVRPLVRNMLYVDVDITPDFVYSEALHGHSVCEVLLLVESPNSRIVHSESLHIPVSYFAAQETFACPPTVVPMMEPKPTHLFVRCVSPNWLACEATAAVCLLNMPLPPIAAPLRERRDNENVSSHRQRGPGTATTTAMTTTGGGEEEGAMEDSPLEVTAAMAPYKLGPVAEQIFPFENFFASQRELVEPIFEDTEDSLFTGVAPGGGKTVIAELFILQFLLACALDAHADEVNKDSSSDTNRKKKKILYITSNEETAERRFMDWRFKFGETLKLGVVKLDRTRSIAAQQADVEDASVLVTTGAALLPWVRAAAAAPVLTDVTHIIADHLHLLRGPEGRATEECVARLQSAPFLVHGGTRRARLLALSYPLISCAELCHWLRIHARHQFNFGLSYRRLRTRVEAISVPGARGRYETSVVSAMKMLQRVPYNVTPSVVFVPYAREAEEVAKRLLLRCRDFTPQQRQSPCGGEDEEEHKERGDDAASAAAVMDDVRLGVLLSAGVGYLHRGTSLLDLLTILDLIERPAQHPETHAGLPLLLVCAFDAAWRLPAALFTTAFVCSAERLSAIPEEDVHVSAVAAGAVVAQLDCGASELLQMTSRAANEAVVFCRPSRQWVWSRLLNDPLPLESNLRYPEDFGDVVNAAVAQRRAGTVMDVLRVLQSHYFLHHVRSNLPFYDLTDAADIPLFASDFASRIVRALKAEGCVSVDGAAARRRDGQNGDDEAEHNRAGEEEEEGEDDEEDPHAAIRPTPRGAAIAHHCLTLDSVRAMGEAVASAMATTITTATTATATTLTQLWAVLASHSDELGPARLGDAARITEAVEYRALHTIARALPVDTFGVRYIDLDFSRSTTKVFLLVLAHCARFFPAFTPSDAEDGEVGEEGEEGTTTTQVYDLFTKDTANHPVQHHPFRHANAAASDVALLCALPPTLAVRLLEDLLQLLPAVTHVVTSMVELMDGAAATAAVPLLMSLAQCIHRRTWGPESRLLQLPVLQAACRTTTTNASLASMTVSLADLQSIDGKKVDATSAALTKAVLALFSPTASTTMTGDDENDASAVDSTRSQEQQRAAQQAYLQAHLLPDARAVPRVCELSASGGIDDGSAVDGVIALRVSVTARLQWSPASRSSSTATRSDGENDEAADKWWLACVARRKAVGAAPVRVLAMRVVTAVPAAASPSASSFSSGVYTVQGQLLFPLSSLEAEGDLDSLDICVTLTSQAFREQREALVAFEAPE